jgi:hypothetical protein
MTTVIYRNNPNLRAPDTAIGLTAEQIQIWIKCSEDFEYFLENYVKILNPDQGYIKLKLFDFQKEILKTVDANKFTVVRAARQVGKSTCLAAYIVWKIIFNTVPYRVGIFADKAATAQEILSRVKDAYEGLPLWLQIGAVKWNELSIELENKSRVVANATTKKAARGFSYNLIVMDEFAHVEPNVADAFYESVQPTVSRGADSKMVIISTPKGMNLYHSIWSKSIEGINEFKHVDVPWNAIPGRDEEFKQKTIGTVGIDAWRQEYECEFLGSSGTLLDTPTLKKLTFTRQFDTLSDVKIYEYPQKNHSYYMCCDTSRGRTLDYSAFTVIDITSLPYKVVATFRDNNISTMLYPTKIHEIAKSYNEAMVLVETNDTTEVSNILYYDLEYENMVFVENGRFSTMGDGRNSIPGLMMNKSVRPTGCNALKSLLERDQLIINDEEIYKELNSFELKGNKYQAADGKHDDLVMCLHRTNMVTTEDGEKTIKWIVDNKYTGKVLSVNSSGKFTWERVIGHSAKNNIGLNKKQWVQIKSYTGKNRKQVICSSDHQCAYIDNILFPEIKWTEAKNLTGKYIIREPVINSKLNNCNRLFNEDQIYTILGIVAGDGSISKTGQFSTAHGPYQIEYMNYIQSILGGNVLEKLNKRNKLDSFLSLQTNAQTKYLRELFYVNGKKTIKNVLQYMNEISLAFWYMDDGYLHGKSGAGLCTESFSLEDVELIQKWLLEKFEIETTSQTSQGARIYIKSNSKEKFFALISPYVCDSMAYKIQSKCSEFKISLSNKYKDYSSTKVIEVKNINETNFESKLYDITVENNHNFMANKTLVHNCLVMFAWSTRQTYFTELTDLNIREKLYADIAKQIEEDMLPIGFYSNGSTDDDSFNW